LLIGFPFARLGLTWYGSRIVSEAFLTLPIAPTPRRERDCYVDGPH